MSTLFETSEFRSLADSITVPESFAPDVHCNLISFLSLAQRFKVDFVPFTWNALAATGRGATADVNQAAVDLAMNFAYKRTSNIFSDPNDLGRTRAFRVLMLEMFLLAQPSIRAHPNIIKLEGICLEIDKLGNLIPVFVLQKADRGSLSQYLMSAEGQASSFDTRQNLCLDIGMAIAALHTAHIVHGDIKPQNTLVFQNDDGQVLAQIIDFGYSSVCSTDEDQVHLPHSIPWAAPEVLHQISPKFKVRDAKKTDVYSFALVCLYTLFWRHFGVEDAEGATPAMTEKEREWRSESKLDALKTSGGAGGIISKVNQLIDDEAGLSEDRKASLREFFQLTLSNRDSRNADFNILLGYLSDTASADIVQLELIYPLDLEFHADYRIADAAHALSYFDYRVRRKITAALEARASAPQQLCRTCQSKAAFQLAFCHKLGFGVGPNIDASMISHWLEKCNGRMHELDAEVVYIRDAVPETFRSQILHELRSRQDFNPIAISVQFLDPAGLRESASIWTKETTNIEALLGKAHPIVRVLRGVMILNMAFANGLTTIEREAKDQIQIMKMALGPEHPDTLAWIVNLALVYKEQGQWKKAQQLLQQAHEPIEKVFGKEHPLALSHLEHLASIYIMQGRGEEAERTQEEVLKKRKALLGEEHPNTLKSASGLASIYTSQGRWKDAEALTKQIKITRKRVFGERHTDTLVSMAHHATAIRGQGRWEDAQKKYKKVAEAMKRVLGPNHPDTLTTMSNLASTYGKLGQVEKAQMEYEKVTESMKRILGPEHPDTLSCSVSLGTTLSDQGRWDEAQKLFDEAGETMKRVLGEEHPRTLETMATFAKNYTIQRRWMEAHELYESTAEAMERILGSEHPDTLNCTVGLGKALAELGRNDEAHNVFGKTMTLMKRVRGQEHPDTLNAAAHFGNVLIRLARWDDALELLKTTVQAMKNALGETDEETLKTMEFMALVYYQQGRLQDAEQLQKRTTETRKIVLGPEHPASLLGMNNLASILWKQGQHRWEESRQLDVVVMETQMRTKGKEHPDTVRYKELVASKDSQIMELQERKLGQADPSIM